MGLSDCRFNTFQERPTFALENNGANACVTSGPFKAIQIQNGKHDYWNSWVRGRHPSRDLDTVDVRHRKVE
jgi:hypothetical protein